MPLRCVSISQPAVQTMYINNLACIKKMFLLRSSLFICCKGWQEFPVYMLAFMIAKILRPLRSRKGKNWQWPLRMYCFSFEVKSLNRMGLSKACSPKILSATRRNSTIFRAPRVGSKRVLRKNRSRNFRVLT